MVSKRIRRTAIGVGTTAVILGGLIVLSRRTDAGGFLTEGLRGFGNTVGQALTQPFVGLIQGVTEGGRDIAESAGIAGADVQEQFTGNRNAIIDALNNLFKNNQGGNQLEISDAVREAARQSSNTVNNLLASGTGRFLKPIGDFQGDPSGQFGGFGTSKTQEDALAALIEENKRKFPEFFN